MKSTLPVLLRSIVFTFGFAASAFAQCNNPASPGVIICTPTNGATVVYENEISIRSSPSSGASITGFAVYDKGTLIYQSPTGESGTNLFDGALINGTHDLVVTATDTAGNAYQATTSFTVTGQGYGPCPLPSSPGINFCNPPKGNEYGVNFAAGASAKGQGSITNLAFYLDGKFIGSARHNSYVEIAVQLAQQDTPYTLTVDATDSNGNKNTASRTVQANYTYGQYSCSFTCPPGINVVTPGSGAYVGNTFNIDMQIVGNTKPITKMKAFLDRTLVATADGPNLQQEVKGAPNGTHILTVEGWDTDGTTYLIEENININVSE
jgi:hypothetical protein